MIVFGVCDDDTAFASLLTKNIRKITIGLPDDVECNVQTFFTAHQVVEYIESSPIHILMLDIDMPDMNGFELAKVLQRKSPSTLIIFVSAYDSYVYDSFQFSPFCFLRKSHLKQELPNIIQKVIDKVLESDETVIFSTLEGEINILVPDITYIKSVGNYYEIHCFDGRMYRCRGTLTSVENILRKNHFYRIHPAFLINMLNIRSVNASHQIILTDNTSYTVSFRKWKGFNEAYMLYSRRRVLLT